MPGGMLGGPALFKTQPPSPRFLGVLPRPFYHPTSDEFRARAEEAGFIIDGLDVEDHSWDFGNREAFVAFARATFVAWTGLLPEPACDPFIGAILDRYRILTADDSGEANIFKFYQINATLARPGDAEVD